jgi:site-specific DNA-methyltransferase (adenine-specific)
LGAAVILQGDGLALFRRIPTGSVDLVFADPPFNIGYEYDTYKDNRPVEEYLDWSRSWGAEVDRVLKPDGTFWLAIGEEFAAELKLIFKREIGLTVRSSVVWYYTFGVACSKQFSLSHTMLYHFVKDPKRFTFNADAIRVPSARQAVYGDKRANPPGKVPDDVWILRPGDAVFDPEHDVWCFSRVCGTFKERSGHPCQMPELLLERIVAASSNPGDLVLDPFAGSGTTLVVARRTGRRCLGFELSPEYATQARARLAVATPSRPTDSSSPTCS